MDMHPGVKLRHLRLFLQVADSGSLTAAARVLGLSQPAVSKSLAELEALLGTPLMHRQGRRIVPTLAGEAFRRHAREAMASLAAAARALQPDAGDDRLSVGLLPTVSTRFFPAVAARFLEARPPLTLAIETGAHPVLLRKLRDRQIDLMVGRMPQSAEMAGLEFEFLYEEPIVAVARSGNPHLRRPLHDLLRTVPLILPTRDAIIRRTVDDFLAAQGLSDLRPAVETSTLALGRGLVLASDAVWFISHGVVEAELDLGQVVTIPLGATYLSGAVGMTHLRGLSLPGPMLTLMRMCREAAVGQRTRHGAG